MSQKEYYSHLLSATVRDYPPSVFKYKIPSDQGSNGKNTVSPFIFRLTSLWGASGGKFIVLTLGNKNGNAYAVQAVQKSLTSDAKSDLWRLIQTVWNIPGGAPQARFLIQHVQTGYYLCVPEGSQKPVCTKYDLSKQERFVWSTNWGDRGIFFCDPNQKYYCSGTTVVPDPPQKYVKGGKNCGGFDTTWPIGGKPFLRIQKGSGSTYDIEMSGVQGNPAFYQKTRKNDVENDWYLLYQYGNSSTCPIPVLHGMSVGRVLNWNPKQDYSAQFSISRIPLQSRFAQPKTQTKPAQPQFPRVMANLGIAANDTAVQGGSNPSVFNFDFWQYADYVIYTGNDQGWAPPEFMNLKIPKGVGNTSSGTLFDLLDGERPGQGARLLIPPKNVVESGHKNGCRVLGAIFFQEIYYGGKWQWWVEFTSQPKKMAEKLVDMAKYYGFDGYFLNYESNSYTNSTCSGLCPTAGPYRFVGNKGQCSVADTCGMNPVGQSYGPANETAPFQPKPNDDAYGQYWCHYDPHGQGGPWNPGCNAAPCFRCIQEVFPDGDQQQKTARANLVIMLKHFQKYKKQVNYPQVEFCLYECFAPDGNIAYYGGINDNNIDLWVDENGGKVADSMFTMIPGGGIVPDQQISTYIQSNEAYKGCKTGNTQTHFGWPPNVGPQHVSGKCLEQGFNCIESFTKLPSKEDILKLNEFTGTSNAPFDKISSKKLDSTGNCVCNNAECQQTPYASKMGPLRPYDFYSTIDMSGFEQNKLPSSSSRAISGVPWQEALYCGNTHCVWNQSNAITMPLTSLGLWSATLFNSKKNYDYNAGLNSYLWVAPNGLCANNDNSEPKGDGSTWKGLSQYISEKSTIQTLPFSTSFCLGNGDNFYIDGKLQDKYGSWSDLLQDPLPTWRWWPLQRNTGTNISFDYSQAYQGGNCLKLSGMAGSTNTDYFLFKTKFSTKSPITIEICYSCDPFVHTIDRTDSMIQIGYTLLSSHPKIIYHDLGPYTKSWKKISFTLPSSQDIISTLCVKLKGSGVPYNTYIGQLRLYITPEEVSPPNNLKISKIFSQTETGLTNTNLEWFETDPSAYYLIFMNGTYIGRTSGSGYNIKKGYQQIPILFNAQNTPKRVFFSVQAIGNGGDKSLRSITISSEMKSYIIGIIIIIIVFLISVSLLIANLAKGFIPSYGNWILSIIMIVSLIVGIVFLYKMFSLPNINEKSGNGSAGFMSPVPDPLVLKAAKTDIVNDALTKAKKLQQMGANSQLAQCFMNTYTNPIMTCISVPNPGFTYVITGNWGKDPPPPFSKTGMGGMWLRDACAQLHTYLDVSKRSKNVAKIIEGLIRQCSLFILFDSYANSFNQIPNFPSDPKSYTEGHNGYVSTRNYEPDSLCFVVWLAFQYYLKTGNKDQFDDYFLRAIDKIVTQLQLEQHRHEYQIMKTTSNTTLAGNKNITTQSVYRFDSLPNGGVGSYVASSADSGFTWTGFRPSDDIPVFGYNIPNNMLAVVILNYISQYLPKVYNNSSTSRRISNSARILSSSIDNALSDLSMYNHPVFGKMYAYEIDGLGGDVFTGDGIKRSFTLVGTTKKDCSKYVATDYLGNPTECYPYVPYNDPPVGQHRKDCGCDHFGCSTLDTMGGSDKKNLLLGSRFLEVTVNGKSMSPSSYSLSGRILTFTTAPAKGSQISIRGNFNLMGDANLPSLMAIPYLGYQGRAWDLEVYNNTRKFLLSPSNRWYYDYGKTTLKGVGSGHTAFSTQAGPGMVWPIGLVSQGLTSQDTKEKTELLSMLLFTANVTIANTKGPTPSSIAPVQSVNYMHESSWVQDPNFYTRGWFGWSNAYFAEWIQKLLNTKESAIKNARGSGNTYC